MTNKLTVQDLIDLLTDEEQISVEDRSLPVLFSNEQSSTVTDFTVVRVATVGFTKSGLCLMEDRARRPDKLGDITTVLCLCTSRDAKPEQGERDADADADTQVDT